MSILRGHIPYYQDLFAIDGLLQSPALIFGWQDTDLRPQRNFRSLVRNHILAEVVIRLRRAVYSHLRFGFRRRPVKVLPDAFNAKSLHEILENLGLGEITTLDFADARADWRHDMNLPVPRERLERFAMVIDVGSIEHVFDTRQCLENLMGLVRPGGHLILHTPCKGYFNHGFHVFSPECLIQALKINGFELVYENYSTSAGIELGHPDLAASALIWLAAKKHAQMTEFKIPQQAIWDHYYQDEPKP